MSSTLCSLLLYLLSMHVLFVESSRKTKPFYKKNHNILQLNSVTYNTTINSMVSGDIYFIEYFSHWCHWCKVFKGQYINFAKFIEKYNNNINGYNIKLFAIDLGDRNDGGVHLIPKRYNITGYPTILLFIHSSTNYFIMNSGGSKYDLHRFLKQTLSKLSIAIKVIDFPDEYCLNSINGPNQITDSKGWICKINDINQKTQCCDLMGDYDYYSICSVKKKCDNYFPCCKDYESCIGCCLYKINPLFNGETLQYQFHTNDRKKLLNLQDTYFSNFSYCRNQCRTSSKSTFEGNVYVDYRNYYCYGKDVAKYEEPEKLLRNVGLYTFEIMISKIGESCLNVCSDDTEKNINRKCVDDVKYMTQINSCTAIQKYFINCKGGCMFGYDNFLPAFGVGQSRCYLKATLAKQQDYSCTARHSDYKRLCLCQVISH